MFQRMAATTGNIPDCLIIDEVTKFKLFSQGCTQYYTGSSNYFNSYNYAGGVLLANQKQTICMR
jgi:hypothetical protein